MDLLIDLIPAHARKWLYALLSAALFVYTIIEAAGEDWKSAAVTLITALVTTLATANTDVAERIELEEYDEADLPDLPEPVLGLWEPEPVTDATTSAMYPGRLDQQ